MKESWSVIQPLTEAEEQRKRTDIIRSSSVNESVLPQIEHHSPFTPPQCAVICFPSIHAKRAKLSIEVVLLLLLFSCFLHHHLFGMAIYIRPRPPPHKVIRVCGVVEMVARIINFDQAADDVGGCWTLTLFCSSLSSKSTFPFHRTLESSMSVL